MDDPDLAFLYSIIDLVGASRYDQFTDTGFVGSGGRLQKILKATNGPDDVAFDRLRTPWTELFDVGKISSRSAKALGVYTAASIRFRNHFVGNEFATLRFRDSLPNSSSRCVVETNDGRVDPGHCEHDGGDRFLILIGELTDFSDGVFKKLDHGDMNVSLAWGALKGQSTLYGPSRR
jgi:hypothetical protein